MKKYIVILSKEERDALKDITCNGTHKSQQVLNAQILLGVDEGELQKERLTNEEIARVPGVSMRKIDRVKKRFIMGGMEAILTRKKGKRVYERKIDGDFEAILSGKPERSLLADSKLLLLQLHPQL